MTKYEATQKIKRLLDLESQEIICKKIGISRPTLYTRLKEHNWKVAEIFLIEKI